MNRALCPFILACLLATPALAFTIPAPPPGMCVLDLSDPAQQVVADYVKAATMGNNQVMAIFADCGELKAVKAKQQTRLSHYGTILVQQLPEGVPMTRSQFVASAVLMMQSSSLVTEATTQGFDDAASAAKSNELSGTDRKAISKGVLFQNPDMAVLGMQQSQHIGDKDVQVASTAGVTLIQGQSVSVNLYRPATEADAWTASKTALQAYIPQLIAANP